MRPHRRQPTRLPHPWDSPGKNTGVGCHFLLQCMKVKSESEVTQSCPTLHDPMDCSLPGSSARGIFQARVLEWSTIAFPIVVYSFIIKGKVRRGRRLLCLSWIDVVFSSSTPPPDWAQEFSCPCVIKLGPQICFHVCREHILGIINLLSSLGKICVSCHHWFIVWEHVLCFCC